MFVFDGCCDLREGIRRNVNGVWMDDRDGELDLEVSVERAADFDVQKIPDSKKAPGFDR